MPVYYNTSHISTSLPYFHRRNGTISDSDRKNTIIAILYNFAYLFIFLKGHLKGYYYEIGYSMESPNQLEIGWKLLFITLLMLYLK